VLDQILGGLRRDGIAAANAVELFGAEVCDRLDKYLFEFRDNPQTVAIQQAFERGEHRTDVLKPHLVKTDEVGCDMAVLDEVGRHDAVKGVVSQFLVNPRLYARNGWWMFPRPYDRKKVWSESWHRDPEAARLVKTFYFPEDVTAEHGPMQYIPLSRDGCPFDGLCAAGGYPTYDIDQLVHPDCVVTCAVPARTFIFADTSALHRGGYTKSLGRLSATWCYIPQP
jgi:hypothetical protein